MNKTAIVIGATGLVGRELTRLLLQDKHYNRVKVFARRSTGLVGRTLEEHIVDFDKIDEWQDALRGDDLFLALGTTKKQAGSNEAAHRVDFTYQYETARRAAGNGVTALHLVSSAGADPKAHVFYIRMKGEIEQAVANLPFQRVVIYQPSLLVGAREHPRFGERAGEVVLKALTWIPGVRRYRPIEGETLARAMIATANRFSAERVECYTLDEIPKAALS
jgi:uncharacterized protein YbjT (DUF2867 family)